MLSIFKRSLRAGVVTEAYPHVAEAAPAAFRGQVTLQPNLCTGDGACARVCPSQAITVDRTEGRWTWNLDNSRCVFCGLCADVCPTNAISLTNEFELAVRNRSDLATLVSFSAEGRDPS